MPKVWVERGLYIHRPDIPSLAPLGAWPPQKSLCLMGALACVHIAWSVVSKLSSILFGDTMVPTIE